MKLLISDGGRKSLWCMCCSALKVDDERWFLLLLRLSSGRLGFMSDNFLDGHTWQVLLQVDKTRGSCVSFNLPSELLYLKASLLCLEHSARNTSLPASASWEAVCTFCISVTFLPPAPIHPFFIPQAASMTHYLAPPSDHSHVLSFSFCHRSRRQMPVPRHWLCSSLCLLGR